MKLRPTFFKLQGIEIIKICKPRSNKFIRKTLYFYHFPCRNLKLKAHLSDIPVSKMPEFVRWAFGGKGGSAD